MIFARGRVTRCDVASGRLEYYPSCRDWLGFGLLLHVSCSNLPTACGGYKEDRFVAREGYSETERECVVEERWNTVRSNVWGAIDRMLV